MTLAALSAMANITRLKERRTNGIGAEYLRSECTGLVGRGKRPEKGRKQVQSILRSEPCGIVEPYFLGGGCFFPVGKVSDKMVQGAEGAHAIRKNLPKTIVRTTVTMAHRSGRYNVCVVNIVPIATNGSSCTEPVDGPASQTPQFRADGGDDAEPREEREKEDLAYSSCLNDFHISLPLPPAVRGSASRSYRHRRPELWSGRAGQRPSNPKAASRSCRRQPCRSLLSLYPSA